MSYAFPPEIRLLVDQNLATGAYSSEDAVLEAALHALNDYEGTIADIRQGIIDYAEGRGEPLSDAISVVRRQLDARS